MTWQRRIPLLTTGIAIALIAGACDYTTIGSGEEGSGNLVTETRDVPAFTSIDVSSALKLDVTVEPDTDLSVTVTFDDNLLDNLSTRVDNDTLIVDIEGSVSFGSGDRVIVVTMPSIDSLKASGATDVTISGSTDRIAVEASGASDVDMSDLTVIDVDVEESGASDVRLAATGVVSGTASGASEVTVRGNPVRVEVETSGASSVDLP